MPRRDDTRDERDPHDDIDTWYGPNTLVPTPEEAEQDDR
jgi:hypothetical protein